jgi:predicted RND superfamily exporter protein
VMVGCAWTFGLSHFIVGHLNASSAFLGPIIPGNGINFGLMLLARYIEERRAGRDMEGSVALSTRFTLQGTITASIAASIAYGSLMATDFLGFKHFGIVGGLGMILCWIATFTVMPATIVWLERRWPAEKTREISLYPPGMLAAIPARFIRSSPMFLAIFGIVLGLSSAVLTKKFMDDPFEKNFHKLRSTLAEEKGAEYWQKKINALFGRSITPQVLLVDRPEDVEPVVAHLEGIMKRDGDQSPIGDVTALSKLVPKQQDEKIEVLEEIRKLLNDDLLANLSDEKRQKALELRPPEGIQSVATTDLPEQLRSDFRELDGREGLVILVNPNIKLNQWHVDVIRLTGNTLRSIPLPDGRIVNSSGNYVIYTDMLEAVSRDGPKATFYCCFGVLLLCFAVYRRLNRVAVVAGSLLVGVSTLGAMCWWLDLRINFLNFIAIPLTFGIGMDYSVNTYSRYLLERQVSGPVMAVYQTIVSTGGAVVLCSLTTVIGYGSLLLARNGGLISFGQVAILGEITTLIAAIVFMSAWLTAFGKDAKP